MNALSALRGGRRLVLGSVFAALLGLGLGGCSSSGSTGATGLNSIAGPSTGLQHSGTRTTLTSDTNAAGLRSMRMMRPMRSMRDPAQMREPYRAGIRSTRRGGNAAQNGGPGSTATYNTANGSGQFNFGGTQSTFNVRDRSIWLLPAGSRTSSSPNFVPGSPRTGPNQALLYDPVSGTISYW